MEGRNVYSVLSEVQRALNVPKSRTNKFGGYSYRSLEDINAAAKPLCDRHKCGYFFEDTIEQVGERYYLKAVATFWCDGSDKTVSASAYAREAKDKKGMDEAQITGLASSYARKYAACGLFAIDSGEEVDSMDNRAPRKKQQNQPKEQAKENDIGMEEINAVCKRLDGVRDKSGADWLGAALEKLGITPGVELTDAQCESVYWMLSSWEDKMNG